MFSNNNQLLLKIINGASNIISTSKKIIPIYSDIKPLINKIKNIKEFISSKNINLFKPSNNVLQSKKEETITNVNVSSNPQFFI
jgi:hypothetical protein